MESGHLVNSSCSGFTPQSERIVIEGVRVEIEADFCVWTM